MEHQEEVDVIALALEIKPKKDVQITRGPSEVRKNTLINENKKTMLLTSWDQFAENKGATIANMISTTPVITALQVKVSLYNNLSLSTKGISCIITEPDLRQAAMLRTWMEYQ